jgi:hypothetical protein
VKRRLLLKREWQKTPESSPRVQRTSKELCELFRKQSKHIRFTDFLNWIETEEGTKWITKNSRKMP